MTPPQIKDGEGWPFRLIGRDPYRPDSLEHWLQAINDELFREVDASENLNHSEHESYHNGDQ